MAVLVVTLTASPSIASGRTVGPSYHGLVSAGFGTGGRGCGNSTVASPANFSLRTGLGQLGLVSARAGLCPGLTNPGFARAGTFLFVQINLSLPSGYHSVHPELTIVWTAAARVSTGRGCPPPVPFNYSYGYAPPNSTSAYWENETGALSSCAARAHVYAAVYPLLVDLTNESYFWPSSACHYGPLGCRIFRGDVINESTTGWEFYNVTRYSKGVWNYTAGSYSFNASTTTRDSVYARSGISSAGFYFNDSFVRSHRYALNLLFYLRANVFLDGWVQGGAAASANVSNQGRGLSLARIVVG